MAYRKAVNMQIQVKRCAGCIEDLKKYNPYIDGNGDTIPINQIKIIKTSIKECDNSNLDTQEPIRLDGYIHHK